jgi:hypothetical protein
MIAVTTAMSQAQNDAPATIDRASAYYHYTLARLYAAKATESHDPEDANKAIENYKAAIKADPEATTISEELADFERTGRSPFRSFPVRLPLVNPK